MKTTAAIFALLIAIVLASAVRLVPPAPVAPAPEIAPIAAPAAPIAARVPVAPLPSKALRKMKADPKTKTKVVIAPTDSVSCSQVPSIAYHYPVPQVLAYAKSYGLSAAQLRQLQGCLSK